MGSPNNIGDQIMDAIQDAVTSQDFSNLQKTVGESLGKAADSIQAGIAMAAQNAQIAQQQKAKDLAARQQEFARQQRERNELARVQGRFKGVGGRKAGGYLLTVLGALGVGSVATGLVTTLAGGAVLGVTMPIGAFLTMAAGAAASIALIVVGASRAGLASTFQSYQRFIGTRDTVSVAELAQQTGKSPGRVVKDLKKMIKDGLFTQARLDISETQLMVSARAYRKYLEDQAAMQERAKQERLLKSVESPSPDAAPITPEAQAILDRGTAYVAKIRESNASIPGEEVSRKLDQTELVVNSIFERAREHPEVIPDLERMMDYYLPVTVKLLDAYRDLDSQPIQSESIIESKREIENTLDTLNVAFEKLLDSIFRDMTWDVSTDISVLHTVLAQEGLVNDPFDRAKQA